MDINAAQMGQNLLDVVSYCNEQVIDLSEFNRKHRSEFQPWRCTFLDRLVSFHAKTSRFKLRILAKPLA